MVAGSGIRDVRALHRDHIAPTVRGLFRIHGGFRVERSGALNRASECVRERKRERERERERESVREREVLEAFVGRLSPLDVRALHRDHIAPTVMGSLQDSRTRVQGLGLSVQES